MRLWLWQLQLCRMTMPQGLMPHPDWPCSTVLGLVATSMWLDDVNVDAMIVITKFLHKIIGFVLLVLECLCNMVLDLTFGGLCLVVVGVWQTVNHALILVIFTC